MKKALLFLSVNLIPLILFSQEFIAKQEWQTGSYGYDIGVAGIIAEDLDGDGLKELICTTTENSQGWKAKNYYYVLKFNSSKKDYEFLYISKVYSSGIQSIAVFDYNEDGKKELLMGLGNTEIEVVDLSSYKKIATLKPRLSTQQITQSNVDTDNGLEIIISSTDSTIIFDKNFKRKYKLKYGGKFKIANIDSDSRNEIVYSSGKIVELGLSDGKLEHQFSDQPVSFGTADVNKDNIDDVIYGSSQTITAYDITKKQIIWSQVVSSTVSTLYLFDYNGDGVKDVFWGNESWDDVTVLNGTTGNEEMHIGEWPIDGVENILIDNMDNVEGPEILWTSGGHCTCADFISIYDIKTQEKVWRNDHLDGPFAFAYGDFENDGVMELAVASSGSNSNYDPGWISIYDAKTHQKKIGTGNSFLSAFTDGITLVTFGDIDNDQKEELLVGVEYGHSYTLVHAYNSQFELKKTYEVYGMNKASGVRVVDLDNDRKNEIVITTGTNVFGSTNPEEYENYIYVLDSETGTQKWKSPKLSGIASNTHNLMIGNVDDDEAQEILAINTRSRFDIDDLILIDGKTFEMLYEKSRNYTSLDLGQVENSNRKEIIAGTKTGDVFVLSGNDLKDIRNYNVSSKPILALRSTDFDEDKKNELVFSDGYTLNFYDPVRNAITWSSDSLNDFVATYNSIAVGNFDADEAPELILNVNHAVLQLEVFRGIDSPITAIEEAVNPYPFNAYPNPFQNSVHIDFDNSYRGNVDIVLTSIQGEQLYKASLNKTQTILSESFNFQNLPVGFYLMKVNFGGITKTKKLIKR